MSGRIECGGYGFFCLFKILSVQVFKLSYKNYSVSRLWRIIVGENEQVRAAVTNEI